MECNKDEAYRAKEIAASKFGQGDYNGAKNLALKAQRLYPNLDGISSFLANIDLHVSAMPMLNGEKDWYKVLGVSSSADKETIRKQYRKWALLVHPDKNREVGSEAAFQLLNKAFDALKDDTSRSAYDRMVNIQPIRPNVPTYSPVFPTTTPTTTTTTNTNKPSVSRSKQGLGGRDVRTHTATPTTTTTSTTTTKPSISRSKQGLGGQDVRTHTATPTESTFFAQPSWHWSSSHLDTWTYMNRSGAQPRQNFPHQTSPKLDFVDNFRFSNPFQGSAPQVSTSGAPHGYNQAHQSFMNQGFSPILPPHGIHSSSSTHGGMSSNVPSFHDNAAQQKPSTEAGNDSASPKVARTKARDSATPSSSVPPRPRKRMQNTRRRIRCSVSACSDQVSTFWTQCDGCKMKFEYLSEARNRYLHCSNCDKDFQAVEVEVPSAFLYDPNDFSHCGQKRKEPSSTSNVSPSSSLPQATNTVEPSRGKRVCKGKGDATLAGKKPGLEEKGPSARRMDDVLVLPKRKKEPLKSDVREMLREIGFLKVSEKVQQW